MVTLKGVLDTIQTKYNAFAKQAHARYDGSRVQKYVNWTGHQISENKKPIAAAVVAAVAAHQFGLLDLEKTIPSDSGVWGLVNRIHYTFDDTVPTILGSIVRPVINAVGSVKEAVWS